MNSLNPEQRLTAAGPGRRLREGREAKNWSRAQLARQLHLPERTIQLLEENDFERLPPATFVRGYLRSCARLLDLPAEELLAEYAAPQERGGPVRAEPATSPASAPRRPVRGQPELPSPPLRSPTDYARTAHRERRKSRSFHPFALLLLVGLPLAVWWGMRQPQTLDAVLAYLNPADDSASTDAPGTEDMPAATDELRPPTLAEGAESSPAPGEPPVPAAPVETAAPEPLSPAAPASGQGMAPSASSSPDAAPTTPANEGTATVMLRFSGSSWATVIDANGRRLLFEEGIPGESKTLQGSPPFKVVLGRPADVAVEYNGEPFLIPGANNRAPVRFEIPTHAAE